MKPVLIQHIIRQLKKVKPKRVIETDNAESNSSLGTIFVLVLALIILIVALE